MTECSPLQKQSCREGCCRLFANVAFCDIESNCVATPTWIIVLVPLLLGLAALGLVTLLLIKLKGRNVIDRQVFIKNNTSMLNKIKQRQQSQRQFISGVR